MLKALILCCGNLIILPGSKKRNKTKKVSFKKIISCLCLLLVYIFNFMIENMERVEMYTNYASAVLEFSAVTLMLVGSIKVV